MVFILLLISYLLLIYFGIDINSLFNTIYCDSDDEDSDDEDNGNDNDNGVVANSLNNHPGKIGSYITIFIIFFLCTCYDLFVCLLPPFIFWLFPKS